MPCFKLTGDPVLPSNPAPPLLAWLRGNKRLDTVGALTAGRLRTEITETSNPLTMRYEVDAGPHQEGFSQITTKWAFVGVSPILDTHFVPRPSTPERRTESAPIQCFTMQC